MTFLITSLHIIMILFALYMITIGIKEFKKSAEDKYRWIYLTGASLVAVSLLLYILSIVYKIISVV